MHQTSNLFHRIRNVVCQIPPGKVAYYSQVGRLCGCSGRVVGFAMAGLRGEEAKRVPWQRVVNIQGRVSPRGPGSQLQRQLLEQEGVVFRPDGSIDFKLFLWGEADLEE